MVLQTLTYQCDAPKCDTPPHVDTFNIGFKGAVARPNVPDGWLYLGDVGLVCARHGAKFDDVVRKFFTEQGHE